MLACGELALAGPKPRSRKLPPDCERVVGNPSRAGLWKGCPSSGYNSCPGKVPFWRELQKLFSQTICRTKDLLLSWLNSMVAQAAALLRNGGTLNFTGCCPM
jgi:hypothetical protein